MDFFRFFFRTTKNDKQLVDFIRAIFGIKPGDISLYKQAFIHKSILREEKNAHSRSNERLEFLGDAVLDNIVAEFLYAKFPHKDEGFLTQFKARIVNGEQLNRLAVNLGLDKFTQFQQFGDSTPKSLYGDVMEALIGALYLDKGFEKTRKIILEKLLTKHFDIKKLASNNDDYKSRLLIWAQRKRKKVFFKLINETQKSGSKWFEIALFIDDDEVARSQAGNKRQAEKEAAHKAIKKLRIA